LLAIKIVVTGFGQGGDGRSMRVLVVEDNGEFARLVTEHLMRAGFDTDQARHVAEAERAVAALDYVAIILDLGLPDQDGLQFLRNLRSEKT
jgi:two-component system response regulator QseB